MADLHSPAEKNARMRARADYFRWLSKYYSSAELAEMSDEPEPVNLRQIFVPMRVSTDSINETDMATPDEVAKKETLDQLPGEDAFELLAEQPFVCLSGLPGSGKTTFTKALIGELCGNHPSRLRTKLQGQRGIAPIPLILRNFSHIERIHNLEQLMAAWWEGLVRQCQQGDSLDIDRLQTSFAAEGEAFPLLLLFDGLDETGGPDVRQTIINIAAAAVELGHRVLVTGRPNGFEKLNIPLFIVVGATFEIKQRFVRFYRLAESDKGIEERISVTQAPYSLLPLAWPQIQQFIERWYRLRPEWEIKRQEGMGHFLEALQDNNRAYLLTLARRPIFLTLMALVHCTRNEMPHGRAELYEAIVDLYLNRQERHRQLKYSTQGTRMPVWPANEKRRVLAHIAYESQLLGAQRQQEQEEGQDEQRRIVWRQTDLLQFIEKFLSERAHTGNSIVPGEAGALLDYFLHPAGLLIAPRTGEISFAHLSFQEYLCGEAIQRNLSGRRFEQEFQEKLVSHLSQPGWDEVALLLLAMHKNRVEDGHLELLSLLDLREATQARLFIDALGGKELGFSAAQLQEYLPLLLLAYLLNSDFLFIYFDLAEEDLPILIQLVSINADQKASKNYWLSQSLEPLWDEMRNAAQQAWLQIAPEERLLSLLRLITNSVSNSIGDKVVNPIHANLADAILQALQQTSVQFWLRDNKQTPFANEIDILLDICVPADSDLCSYLLAQMPLDAWLLEGELAGYSWGDAASSKIWLSLYPSFKLPARSRLAIALYPLQLLTQCLAETAFLNNWPAIPSILWSSMVSVYHGPSRARAQSKLKSNLRSSLRSLARELINYYPAELKPKLKLSSVSESQALSRLFLSSKHLILPLLQQSLQQIVADDIEESINIENQGLLVRSLASFAALFAAHDWFCEQREQPEWTVKRGLRPGLPVPAELAIFAEDGYPLALQSCKQWQQLLVWLNNDDELLSFVFPEGLTAVDDKILREDLAILRSQPWSPQALIQSAINTWPDGQELREFSFDMAQRQLLEHLESLLAGRKLSGKQ